jgi:tetratricopeptide (TPR) repeat protein
VTYVAGNLASIHYEQGQLDMAILHYKQAIACDPRFLEAYNNLVGLFSYRHNSLKNPRVLVLENFLFSVLITKLPLCFFFLSLLSFVTDNFFYFFYTLKYYYFFIVFHTKL